MEEVRIAEHRRTPKKHGDGWEEARGDGGLIFPLFYGKVSAKGVTLHIKNLATLALGSFGLLANALAVRADIIPADAMIPITPDPIIITPGIQPDLTVQLPPDLMNTSGLTPDQLKTESPQNDFAFTANSFTGAPLIMYFALPYDDPEQHVVVTTLAEPWTGQYAPFVPTTCEEQKIPCGGGSPPPCNSCKSPPTIPEPKGVAIILAGLALSAALSKKRFA
jgi:hypothetical protein